MVKAAVLENIGKIKVYNYPEPKVKENGILLKMELCGVRKSKRNGG
jgi:D-arabinose 1-dehydrogenase-like Zn-dependent alcohol dehydrogenase